MDNIVEAEYREISALEDKDTLILTIEANAHYQNAEMMAEASMMELVEVGRRLNVIKEREGHGNWEEWMENNLNFSSAKAKRTMKLAKNVDENVGIFSNRSTLTDIGISKVWALLGAPEEVQKEVVENPEIKDASVREFKEEIKRLKQEKEEQEEKHRMDEENHLMRFRELQEEKRRIEERLEEAQAQSTEKLEEDLAKMSETAVRNHEAALKEAEKVEKLLKEKERIEKALEEAKEDLKKKPETVIDEKAIERAVSEAKKEAERELAKLKEELEAHTQSLEEENKNLSAIIERSKKETDSTNIIFKEKFEAFRTSYAAMLAFIEQDPDADRKKKFKGAVKQAFEKMEAKL